MSKKQFLKAKKDPNCMGITYRIPWGKLVEEDNKKLSHQVEDKINQMRKSGM